jgi:hypothetical protein
VLTNAQASNVKLGTLISAGLIVAVPDPYRRRAAAAVAPQPTYIAPGAYPNTGEMIGGTITVTKDPDPGDELRAIFDVDFPGPMGWSFGDDTSDYQNDNHTAHPYGAAGTYLVVAQSATHRAQVSVTVPIVAPGRGVDAEALPETATVAQVKEWVGDDPQRAAQALAAEQDRPGGGRVTLLEYLNSMTTGQDAPAE